MTGCFYCIKSNFQYNSVTVDVVTFSFNPILVVGNSWVPNSLSGHNAREESEREDENDKLGDKEEDSSAPSLLVGNRQSLHVDFFIDMLKNAVDFLDNS